MIEKSNNSQNNTRDNAFTFFSVLTVLIGVVLIGFHLVRGGSDTQLLISSGFVAAGILLYFKWLPKKLPGGFEFSRENISGDPIPKPLNIPKRELTSEQKQEKQRFSKSFVVLPGGHAPKFHLLEESLALRPTPCADPMMPMYLLDAHFRIIDWNEAFTLAFERTMEGRRGQNVLEWVYFLDNYEEVLKHGAKVFGDAEQLPRIDVETVKYSGSRYGKITGTKRAYPIPDDNGDCEGWLVTIEPFFEEKEKKSLFYTDLITSLRQALVWSEYALSYDIVLNNTRVYPELIQTLIGESTTDLEIPPTNARILDLGAGTGNITMRLADTGTERLIVALDNNPMMLNILRSKCQKYLRHDPGGPGVIATRQDISSLFGLKDNYFDYAFLNNVLYSVDENLVISLLREVHRVLKPDGEIRISGPKKLADLDVLFKRMEDDLRENGKLEELNEPFHHVMEINYRYLQPMLRKWDVDDIQTLLTLAGFSTISYTNCEIYAGQSRIVCAKK